MAAESSESCIYSPNLGLKREGSIFGNAPKEAKNSEKTAEFVHMSKLDEDEIYEEPSGDGMLPDECYREDVSIGNYKILKTVGKGSSGSVILAQHRDTGEKVAIKIIQRKGKTKADDSGMNDNRIYREIVISSLINHPNIVRLLDFFYSPTYFFLVFEYVQGSQLYDTVVKSGSISEEKARKYFRQILSAVDYLHRNCIAHRDLKIENILIDHNDNAKIIDFGLSNFFDNKNLLSTFCGSLYFAAPELLMGHRYYGAEVDIWSLGVILYVMLCGKVPFDDDSIQDLQNKIKNGEFEFKASISSDAQDLISHMLVPDSLKRAELKDIIGSEWAKSGYSMDINNYMSVRSKITVINEECLNALVSVLSFQFVDIEKEIREYVDAEHNNFGSLQKIYWSKRPVVALYHLLLEEYSQKMNRPKFHGNLKVGHEHQPSNIYNFVRFIFSEKKPGIYSKYFIKSAFSNGANQNPASPKGVSNLWPCVRKSYLKGFFKGIRAQAIGSSLALKKKLIDLFRKLDISYEINEKSYFCTYYDGESECFFKISLYYNVIIKEYYLITTCLNSRYKAYRQVCEKICTLFAKTSEKNAAAPQKDIYAPEAQEEKKTSKLIIENMY
ncbi:serine/threonine protein kinase KIN1/2 [Enteropsectra breve]|nr:serine/threonine protein kinase KIN1/2 [Enteropsectra breve]